MKYSSKETIFALSTNYAQSAVAIIRVSGNNSKKIAQTLCKLKNPKNRYANYSNIYDMNFNLIDKGIIIFFKSPESFTGEDILEFHIHGSIAIIKKLTKTLQEFPGTRAAMPGEFSKRAFFNGKGSMLYFEGINNLINSETETQREISNKQIYGEGANKCDVWKNQILEFLSTVDAQIEFSDDLYGIEGFDMKNKINLTIQDIENVYKSINNSNNLVHGISIMIVGPSNAGKSSLFNFMIQEDKMIVSNKKGTTTDQTEQITEIRNHKVKIIDSAGIRNSNNTIEKIGVKKSLDNVKMLDKFILVVSPDSYNNINVKIVEDLVNKIKKKKAVIIFNKKDLQNSDIKFSKWKKRIDKIKKIKSFSISCRKDVNDHKILNKLHKFIEQNLISIDTKSNDYYFSELRHKMNLENLIENLRKAVVNLGEVEICAKYLRDAINDLDHLYGHFDEEDKLELIFNKFCIGK